MRFKIGDIVKDITEQDYILYEITGNSADQDKRILVKIIELPNDYNGYLKVGKVYSDYTERYTLIKRIYKGKGYQPSWL